MKYIKIMFYAAVIQLIISVVFFILFICIGEGHSARVCLMAALMNGVSALISNHLLSKQN